MKLLKRLLQYAEMREYQWKAFWFIVRNKLAALFLDMGLGKTIIVLSAIKHLKHKRQLTKPVLIVAPIRVMYNVWRQEAHKWRHTRSLTFSIVHGNVKQRMHALNVPADIYLINPQGLVWLLTLLDNDNAKANWPFGWLIIDESSMFKSAGTKRFTKLRHRVEYFERRTILTGTPTPNSLLEIWAQIFILDAGARLGTAFTRFKERFFYQADHQGYDFQARRGASQYITRLIRDIVLRMDAEDYIKDMPPTSFNTVWVNLPADARRIYDELEEEMFVELAAGDVEALNAASLSGRCHQLANGAIYSIERGTEQKIWEPVHDAKIEALKEILAETSTPVIVAYHFKHDYHRLKAAFPDAPSLQGKRDLTDIIEAWQRGDIPVLLAHPASAGYGLDGLQHGPGHTLIYFSLTWSREQYEQLLKRIAGARATKPIMVHHIAARQTVDEAILLSGESKDTTQAGLLNSLREYRDGRVRQEADEDFELLDFGEGEHPPQERGRRRQALDARRHTA